LVPLTGRAWSYNDDGTSPSAGWQNPDYAAESQWRSGLGLFGIESSFPYPYPAPLSTPLVLNAGRITYFFRTHFTFTGPTNGFILMATAYIDDGAVLYLNGHEVGRVRLPAGPIDFSTLAAPAFPEGLPFVFECPAGALVQGDNVLAAEVHQSSATSSDVVFGMSLETYTLVAPTLVDPSQPADAMVNEGDPVMLEVEATGFPTPVYQWFKESQPIPGAAGSSLSLPSVGPAQAGHYFVVVTNRAGSLTSRMATVSFLADVTPPTVLYAVGRPNLTEILIVFSEPMDELTTGDYLNWDVLVAGGGPELFAFAGRVEEGTNLVLTTDPRDGSLSYIVTNNYGIPDLHGNNLPEGTLIPIASFTSELVSDSAGQTWRYDQSGIERGTEWTGLSYDDSAWQEGACPFDVWRRFGDTIYCRANLPEPSSEEVRTCLSLSNTANTVQIPTSYFRTHFQFEGNASNAVFYFESLVNDGVVLYLNGVELVRLGLSDGPVSYSTLANRNPITPGSWFEEKFYLPVSSLRSGENVLAAELHQSSLTSPDLTFVLSATGYFVSAPTLTPQLSVGFAAGNVEVTWTPAAGTLQAADDVAGPWIPIVPSNPPSRHVTPAIAARQFYRVVVP
jgi:hypothetical protein